MVLIVVVRDDDGKIIMGSFRPLAGIMVLIKFGSHASVLWYEFPSPCGDYGSYLFHDFFYEYANDDWFPSPCGDYGSYQSRKDDSIREVYEEFPSPCGDYGSYQNYGYIFRHQLFTVSVPLRGLWFLSAPFINAFMKPSKWHFAGRIIYFHHFLSFAGK